MEKRKELKKSIERTVTLACGAVFYAVAYRFFIEPSTLILGGATGMATLLWHLASLPVDIGILVVNAPLILWGWRKHGLASVLHAALGIAASAVALSLFARVEPPVLSSALGAVLGGAFGAVGIALLLWYGFTTGGTELAAVLIKERFSRLAIGKIIFLIDTVIVFISSLFIGETEALAYSVLLNVAFAFVLDAFLRIKLPIEE